MIHAEVKTAAEAMASCVRAIDAQGQLSKFLPSLVAELGVAFYMTQRELLIYIWSKESETS